MTTPFTITAGPSAELIHVVGTGLWTPTQVEDHFRDLQGHLRLMRAQKGRALVLIDMREALVQPANTARTLHELTARAYRTDDRVAVVCTRALLAMQLRHAAKIYARAPFTTVEAARDWLLAPEPAPVMPGTVPAGR